MYISAAQIYVANNRGGELGVFRIVDDQVVNRIALGAASGDVVQIADKVYVVTTTPFRGFPSVNASATGNRVYIPLSASDVVQEFSIVGGDFRLQASGTIFNTRERPFAVALDEDNQQLLSVAWGGEVLEVFDVATGDLIDSFDLGYAQPAYPATTMEADEYFYQSAKWSNDGDKSCATCHYDELLSACPVVIRSR